MATATASRSLRYLLDHDDEDDQNPIAMSDQHILRKVYATHLHTDTNFDSHSLFSIVDVILQGSTHIVDNVLEGTHVTLKLLDHQLPQATFTSPLCTLKQISSQMCCKPPGDEVAHRTTMSILNLLSDYSWDAKAALVLAAFALEYGEFWWLSQLQPTDALAKSVAILKRVSVLTKPTAVREHFLAIYEINNLIKAALQMTEAIFEIQKLASHDTTDVPALASAIDQVPFGVYWAIITVVACVTQIDCLTTNSDQRQELSYFGQKINLVLGNLRKQIFICRQQIEEAESYRRLRELFQSPTEILELFKVLIFSKDEQQQLFDGASQQMVDIDLLRRKNVLLLISTLDITEEEISILLPVYQTIKTNDQYKIVWIPIVGEWNDQLIMKFEFLKSKMPWYTVELLSLAGYKYIMEEWHFKKKPIIVVLNSQGKVLNADAFQLIQVRGMKAFPFTSSGQSTTTIDQGKIDREQKWVVSVVGKIHPSLEIWITERRYILLYGGNDGHWIRRFTKYATDLVEKAILKEVKISIELFCVDKDNSLINRFWNSVDSWFEPKVHKNIDDVPEEVKKMLAYRNEGGWALLLKGSSLVLSGYGGTIMKTVAEFERWKGSMLMNGFEFSVKEYHNKVKAYEEMVMRSARGSSK